MKQKWPYKQKSSLSVHINTKGSQIWGSFTVLVHPLSKVISPLPSHSSFTKPKVWDPNGPQDTDHLPGSTAPLHWTRTPRLSAPCNGGSATGGYHSTWVDPCEASDSAICWATSANHMFFEGLRVWCFLDRNMIYVPLKTPMLMNKIRMMKLLCCFSNDGRNTITRQGFPYQTTTCFSTKNIQEYVQHYCSECVTVNQNQPRRTTS